MRNNCRTYELFEIAHLILEKPERYVVMLEPKPALAHAPQSFWLSLPDHLPFETEEAAINHVLATNLDHFVETEEVEVEAPKGNFPVIHKCGVTGRLIGPPNYHRYQALLQEHHAANCPQLPFSRFKERLESVKGEEVVAEWATQMSKQKRYKLKKPEADTPEFFESLESLRYLLSTRRKSELVKQTDQVRLAGPALGKLPRGIIRDSIEAELEFQRRFPLITANNLRGRLRRLRFTIYKKGGKGVSYVCAVKRKFRDGQRKFSESIQELFDFLDAHPMMTVADLPEQFLGIKPSSKPSAAKTPEIEQVQPDEAAKIVEVHEVKRAERRLQQASASATVAPEVSVEVESVEKPTGADPESPPTDPTDSGAESATVEASAVAADSPSASKTDPEIVSEENPSGEPEGRDQTTAVVINAPTEVPVAATRRAIPEPTGPIVAGPEPEEIPPTSISRQPGQIDPESIRLRSLVNSLRWLVTEGYVVEFGDGRLFANPVMEAPVAGSKAQQDRLAEEDSDDEEAADSGDSQDEDALAVDERHSASLSEVTTHPVGADSLVIEAPPAESAEGSLPTESAIEAALVATPEVSAEEKETVDQAHADPIAERAAIPLN